MSKKAQENKAAPQTEQPDRHQNAINKFLTSYQAVPHTTKADTSSSDHTRRTQRNSAEPQKPERAAVTEYRKTAEEVKNARRDNNAEQLPEFDAEPHRSGGKRTARPLLVGAWVIAIVSLLSAAIAIYFAFGPPLRTDKTETAEREIAQYISFTENALAVTQSFKTESWPTSDSALAAFANMLNGSLPAEWRLAHQPGASFATGKADPWGTLYYITARQLNDTPREDGNLYCFHITTAGPGKRFDTESFLLDNDDISDTLVSMSKYAQMGGTHTILPTEPASSGYSESVPITFDMGEGSGGTAFLTILPGDPLPQIEVPSRDGWTFCGYYEFPNGVGARYWDELGRGCIASPFSSGTTIHAAWVESAPAAAPTATTEEGGVGDEPVDLATEEEEPQSTEENSENGTA